MLIGLGVYATVGLQLITNSRNTMYEDRVVPLIQPAENTQVQIGYLFTKSRPMLTENARNNVEKIDNYIAIYDVYILEIEEENLFGTFYLDWKTS